MSWTRAQEEAITARGGNLLLAAAAGSGKTAVLVERIIRRVLDPKDPATITDILVMKDKKMYGTICGKCIYKKTLDLREAVGICK